MSLLLKWAKRNAVPVITEIYRSSTPLDKANLPAPLVTLTNQEVEYLDTTAVTGQSYYYMWVSYNMQHGSPAYSPSTLITVAQRRGVGPNILLTGNADCGYFGDVTQSELATVAGILAVQNVGAATPGLTNFDFVWRKCIYKGKIIYVPSLPQFLDTFLNIYRAGFVYGRVDRSKLPVVPGFDSGLSVAQDKRITIAGDQYSIRLLRGYSDDIAIPVPTDINATISSVTTGTDTTPAVRYDNEFDALFLPNISKTPYCQGMQNYPNAMRPGNTVRYGTYTMEVVTANNVLVRGGSLDANSNAASRAGVMLYRQTAYTVSGASAVVLELIEA